MTKSFFSRLLTLLLIIAVIVLSYFVIILKIEISKTDASATENVDASDDKIIVAMFDCVLGTFENNTWYNAQYGYESDLLLDKEIYEKEIENGSNYYIHEEGKEIIDLGKDVISKTEDYEYMIEEDGMISDSHFRLINNTYRTERNSNSNK